jgi:DNA-binding XRE family transcriptional regulator
MGKVQFVKTDAGEIAIMPRAEYERLAGLAASEDVGTRRIVRRARAAVARGEEVLLPKAVADKLANGDNPIRVLREWRDMTQLEMSYRTKISQGHLSDIENGRRTGTAETLRRIAEALHVPLDLIVP